MDGQLEGEHGAKKRRILITQWIGEAYDKLNGSKYKNQHMARMMTKLLSRI